MRYRARLADSMGHRRAFASSRGIRSPRRKVADAIVGVERRIIHKFGAPNDEVIEGRRLTGKGLVAYCAHAVERSRWIERMLS
jgi:hypothetical protein